MMVKRNALISILLALFFMMSVASVGAVDVKFRGSYYVRGVYESNHSLLDDSEQSTAFFHQRVRIGTVFQVSPGLALHTRFDAVEKIWGDNNWAGSRSNVSERSHEGGNKYTLERENIEFEMVYVQYYSPIGIWRVGYVPHDTQWGTIWGTSERMVPMIQWTLPINTNFTIGAKYMKNVDGSYSAFTETTATDTDKDSYSAVIVYKQDNLDMGFKWAYLDSRETRDKDNYMSSGHLLTPYIIWGIGQVKLQAELEYFYGKRDYDNGNPDIDMRAWSAYFNGELVQGSFALGATVAYASGDDPDTTNKFEGLPDSAFSCWGGLDYDPGLILWNDDRNEWIGPLKGNGSTRTTVRSGVSNALLFLVYVSYRPTEKLDFKATWLYAKADEKPTMDGKPSSLTNPKFVDDEYGHELDIIATYQITNNLSYMVGAGYLWTGDYFKGTDRNAKIDDNYLVTHKLTLIF